MKKAIQLTGIGLALFVVLVVSVKSTFDGFFGFYYDDQEYEKPAAYSFSETVLEWAPVSCFASYTGFDTGYGFFAPNVASDFLLLFELRDSTGRIIHQGVMPPFQQKESVVRYTSLYNMYLEKIGNQKDDPSNKYLQYLDVVMEQIAKSVKSEYPGAAGIDAGLYLYDYPSLAQYRQGDKSEKAILIHQYHM